MTCGSTGAWIENISLRNYDNSMKVIFFLECSSPHGEASKNYSITIIQISDHYLCIIPTTADSVLHFSDTVQLI